MGRQRNAGSTVIEIKKSQIDSARCRICEVSVIQGMVRLPIFKEDLSLRFGRRGDGQQGTRQRQYRHETATEGILDELHFMSLLGPWCVEELPRAIALTA